MTRLKHSFATITSVLMGAVLLAGAGMGIGHATAGAATVDPEPLPEAGWYVVGNGAGDLKTCSWTEYLEDWKLEGDEEGTSSKGYTNYLGTWYVEDLLLYEGDAFKFLYESGDWQYPNDSEWGADIVGQFNNITDNTDTSFVDGGLGNIQANVSGYYNFYLTVEEDADGVVTISIDFSIESTDVPPIVQFDMYIVGSIASVPTCGWPGDDFSVSENCIKMTYNAATKKWTAQVNLIPRDEFKVYNTVNNAYYPSGVNNNKTGYAAGLYEVEWEDNAPDVLVTLISAAE